MRTIQCFASRLASDDNGASLVEYGLLVGMIAVAAVTIISGFTGNITTMFTNIGTRMTTNVPAS